MVVKTLSLMQELYLRCELLWSYYAVVVILNFLNILVFGPIWGLWVHFTTWHLTTDKKGWIINFVVLEGDEEEIQFFYRY